MKNFDAEKQSQSIIQKGKRFSLAGCLQYLGFPLHYFCKFLAVIEFFL